MGLSIGIFQPRISRHRPLLSRLLPSNTAFATPRRNLSDANNLLEKMRGLQIDVFHAANLSPQGAIGVDGFLEGVLMSDEERRETARKLREKIKKKFGKRQAKNFKQSKQAKGRDGGRRGGGGGVTGNDP